MRTCIFADLGPPAPAKAAQGLLEALGGRLAVDADALLLLGPLAADSALLPSGGSAAAGLALAVALAAAARVRELAA